MMIEYSKQTKNCPECDNLILVDAKRCKCGWKISAEKKPSIIYNCCFVEKGKRCNSTKQPMRIHANDKAPPEFWCLYHYEQRRPKSDIEKKFEDGVELLKAPAKAAGMSNKDFCRDLLGLTAIGKNYLKKIDGKGNEDGNF